MVVYIHIFPNGKRYIGLTMRDVNKRWGNGIGYKKQKVVYNAILKYGWNNISHIVYECDTESEMKYLERYLIAYYNTTDHRYGYNVSTGGESGSGVPSVNRKPIDQYDKFGNFIRTWESIMEVEKELNYKNPAICACVRKRYTTSYNFYWCYSGETPEFIKKGTHRKVYQYDLNGNFLKEYKNITEAARALGVDDSVICRCCNGKIKTAFKFIWKYEC